MAQLKVAIYTKSYPPKSGGVDTTQYNLIKLLQKNYKVKVFVHDEYKFCSDELVYKRPKSKLIEYILFTLISIRYKSRRKGSKLKSVKDIISNFYPVLRLNRQLQMFDPDIIIVPDKNLPHYLMKKPVRSKLIYIAHHNYKRFRDNVLIGTNDWLDSDIASGMELKAMKKVDAVVSPSQYMFTLFSNSTYKNKMQFVIPNFIDDSQVEKVNDLKIEQNTFFDSGRIIYIPSAGSKIKGSKYVFELVRRLIHSYPDIKFYLTGELSDELTIELDKFRDKCYAPGHVDWNENLLNIRNCSFALSPTLEDNFSNALLEAQTLGLPVVTFDTGGNKEIINHGLTGFISNYLDIEDLIKSCHKILDDGSLMNQMAHKAKEHACSNFSSSVIQDKYRELFNEVL